MLKRYFLKNNKKKCRQDLLNLGGYTIIETMIAVTLFMIIVTIGMGALLNASLIHRKSQDMRSIMDNLSFAMEDMSRNLRTGYNYRCVDGDLTVSDVPKDCVGGNVIIFEGPEGTSYDPVLDDHHLDDQWFYVISSSGVLEKSVNGGTSFFELTPPGVELDTTLSGSGFTVTGALNSDSLQPFVTIRLVGVIKNLKDNTVTPFSLRTSVSQRLIDVAP